MRTIELREYQPAILHPQELAESEAEALWRLYHGKVDVEFPSIKTGGTYRLTPLGWVGRFPLSNDLSLTLKPKVPIKNIFRMLDYAYRTKGFKLLAGVTE